MIYTHKHSEIPFTGEDTFQDKSLPKFHTYPATMTQPLSSFVIREFSKPGDYVLDPFCGSGNIPRTARVFGRHSVGIDLNPLAVLISRVSLSEFDPEKVKESLEFVTHSVVEVKHDPIFAKKNRLYYWFDPNVLDVIEKLKEAINELSVKEGRELLKLSLSSIVRSVSRADPRIFPPVYSKFMRNSYRRPENEAVIERFRKAASINISKSHLNASSDKSNWQAKIYRSNSFKYLRKDDRYYDLIFTSPPYAAAQKYVRSTSLELMTVFEMNREQLLNLDRNDLGSESVKKVDTSYADQLPESMLLNLSTEYKIIYGRYILRLSKLFQIISSRLKPEGKFALVMGENSTSKGNIVPILDVVKSLAEKSGLMVEREYRDSIKKRNFSIKRYGSVPIMKSEYLLVFGSCN